MKVLKCTNIFIDGTLCNNFTRFLLIELTITKAKESNYPNKIHEHSK